MRVAVLTTVHTPIDVRIFWKQSVSLARAGHEVTLVAPFQSGAADVLAANGIAYVPLAAGGRAARPRRWRQMLAWLRGSTHEVWHFHDPELLPLAILARRIASSRARLVYDVHEDVPRQILAKYWIPRALRPVCGALTDRVERRGARSLTALVAATPPIAARFDGAATVVVQNYPILEELQAVGGTEYETRRPDVVYIGGLTRSRGLLELVDAMLYLPSSVGSRLLLAGQFDPPSFQQALARRPGWELVDFRGWQSRDGIRQLLSQARIGVVTLRPLPRYMVSYPVKLFEYMAAGLPVVASDFPLWRGIVEDAGCGVLVDPEQPRAIAAAIERLLAAPQEAAAMGERGRQAVLGRYNWRNEERKLLALYARLGEISTTPRR